MLRCLDASLTRCRRTATFPCPEYPASRVRKRQHWNRRCRSLMWITAVTCHSQTQRQARAPPDCLSSFVRTASVTPAGRPFRSYHHETWHHLHCPSQTPWRWRRRTSEAAYHCRDNSLPCLRRPRLQALFGSRNVKRVAEDIAWLIRHLMAQTTEADAVSDRHCG